MLGDVKTITRSDSRYSVTALRTGVTQRQGGGPGRRPVDVRADAVHDEYLGHARALDRRHHATAADARGPVEAAARGRTAATAGASRCRPSRGRRKRAATPTAAAVTT